MLLCSEVGKWILIKCVAGSYAYTAVLLQPLEKASVWDLIKVKVCDNVFIIESGDKILLPKANVFLFM